MGRKYCCRRATALSKPGSRIREQRGVHWNSGTINIIDIWPDISVNHVEWHLTFAVEIVRIKTPQVEAYLPPLTRGSARMVGPT